MGDFWWGLDPRRRIGLVAGAFFVMTLVVAFSVWVFRANHSVLFSDLDDRDAAELVAQLESMKVDYRLIDQGSTITVPDKEVHTIRIKLASSGVLLKGGVGFELFDEAEYGMTDFAQKINYQRALQGELARTIGSLQKVKHARVHLVMPESSLFRRSDIEPSAAITVLLKERSELTPDEIMGIQRLVAASVQGLSQSSIVILNERGEVLSNTKPESAKLQEAQLNERLQLEADLRQKAQVVVDSIFGPGSSVVNVTLSLNYDRIQRRIERELPVTDESGTPLVSRSATTKSVKPAAGANGGQIGREGISIPPTTNEVSEKEYRFGKSVEEQVLQAGKISRMSVSVLVPIHASEFQIEQIRKLVAASVALDGERGDVIEVVAMAPASNEDVNPEPGFSAASPLVFPSEPSVNLAEREQSLLGFPDITKIRVSYATIISFTVIFFGFALFWLWKSARRPRLTPVEREQYLAELKEWLSTDAGRVTDRATSHATLG